MLPGTQGRPVWREVTDGPLYSATRDGAVSEIITPFFAMNSDVSFVFYKMKSQWGFFIEAQGDGNPFWARVYRLKDAWNDNLARAASFRCIPVRFNPGDDPVPINYPAFNVLYAGGMTNNQNENSFGFLAGRNVRFRLFSQTGFEYYDGQGVGSTIRVYAR